MVKRMEGNMLKDDLASLKHCGGVVDLFMLYNATSVNWGEPAIPTFV